MSLTFILILLLVIGVVFANIALLRYGSKPMPVTSKKAQTTPDSATSSGQAQAASSTAMPLTTPQPSDTSKNSITAQIDGAALSSTDNHSVHQGDSSSGNN